jgi:hypothetical protein
MLSLNCGEIKKIDTKVPDEINLFTFVKKEDNNFKSKKNEITEVKLKPKEPEKLPEKKLKENKSQSPNEVGIDAKSVSNQIFGGNSIFSKTNIFENKNNENLSIKYENKNFQIFDNKPQKIQENSQTPIQVNNLFGTDTSKLINEKNNFPNNQIISANKIVSQPEPKIIQQVQQISKPSESTNNNNNSNNKIQSSAQANSNISNEKINFLLKDNLLKAANSYWNNREYRIKLSNDPANKSQKNKIMTEYANPTIDQLATIQDLPEKVKTIKLLLKELFENKKFDLYDFTLNYICQKIISKSENYLKDRKQLLLFSQFIYEISKGFRLIEDYYLMILAYKCPYVIPKVFTKKDYSDKDTLMKRLGYSDPEEPVSTWITNIECYCYLFFGYLSLNSQKIEVISEYVRSLEKLPVEFPLSTAFKAFLNSLGPIYKSKVDGGAITLKKLVGRYVKELEEMNKKTKSSDLKSIAADNIHFIKKYFTQSDYK